MGVGVLGAGGPPVRLPLTRLVFWLLPSRPLFSKHVPKNSGGLVMKLKNLQAVLASHFAQHATEGCVSGGGR
jgi:hypothetical protein